MLTVTILRRSLVFLCIMTALTCAYTGVLSLAGNALFPFQAQGSILTLHGRQYSTLLGQPFVKDPEQSVDKLLKARQARVVRFERFELGEGIEKKSSDFAAEVAAVRGDD